MKTPGTIWLKLRSLWQRKAVKREIDEELRFHIEQRTTENITAGMSPEEAGREARKRFGNIQTVREECRETRGASLGETVWQDVRFGLRMMRKNPGFTATAVIVLALAIGGTSAMFSIINALMMRPLAVKSPDELVQIYSKDKKPSGGYRGFSYPNYVDIREKNTVFTDVLGSSFGMLGVAEGDTTRRCFGSLVSANYFKTFGVRLAAGREFLPEEERPGSAIPVVIVSYNYWKRTGANPALVGQIVQINSQDLQVVGIAPEFFSGTTTLVSPEFWLPLGMYEAIGSAVTNERKERLDDRNHQSLVLVGRLKPGLAMTEAQVRLQSVASRLEEDYPAANKDQTFELGRLPVNDNYFSWSATIKNH